MANVIEEAGQAIRTRLAQLEALLAEQQQLKKALEALEGCSDQSSETPPHRRRRAQDGKPSARRPAPRAVLPGAVAAMARAGPTSSSSSSASGPGSRSARPAEQFRTSRNTLYNVTARLQRDGRLRKDGRGFYPAEQAPASASRTGNEPLFESAR